MTISIWRYSHLTLAVSSFLLLTLASITGIFLAFEPISQKTLPYRADNFDQITLAQTLPALRKAYPDISELTVDANQFVTIKATDDEGKGLTAYIDPRTGKVLGKPTKQSEFFQWMTTLHRSLFLHEIGRFFMGLTAFLLMLITISGTALILQRQRSLKRFFAKIVKENFAQYYHVVLGRLSLIPILVIAVTGTYMSLGRFNIIKTIKIKHDVDFDALKSKPERKAADFAVFNNTMLSQVQSVEFPFSEDVEDYYTLKLTDREVTVNQITGDVITQQLYPTTQILSNLSLSLHTGRIGIVWAIVLIIASGNILFFIYSGFVITFKRRQNKFDNKSKADEARFVILVGSENGSTFRFAKAVQQELVKQGEKVFLTELNNYRSYQNAEHLIILTATYGIGDAPTNASKFEGLLAKYQQPNSLKFSVVGFGSHSYPDFCKFAFEVNNLLEKQAWATPLTEIHTINDKSPEDFALWTAAWSQQSGVELDVSPASLATLPGKLQKFKIVDNTSTPNQDTFILKLQPARGSKVTSGDLLAIYPANDHRERLYSIGVIDGNVQLSVKLHNNGFGSGYLHKLTIGQTINARIVRNSHFHFPKNGGTVVLISNGTGIAPFLGMIAQNKKSTCYLYCGFRSSASFGVYKRFLDESEAVGKLQKLNVAFSREGEKQYVNQLILRDAALMAEVLTGGGTIMICGSLAMQTDVIDTLESICSKHTGKSISHYQSHGQVKMDCY
ncbi:FAD-binding oxidoreductase [Mucilaginibacter pallidiroseus]|uniref:FAD-binding oxidoreductase n=1 Tax=Mucilaginibacter pallidiroseus TaxID=2599295 RepID=A0A563U2Z3_9SPHI|nr:PepSY domain-containing protein [Mucilaginibacter pallidiroseus]TWR25704.1 FAD-binding oxidoreductase [Mucilaginibacter pallidiroseus]